MTWDIFGTASRGLAQMVVDDGYEPDMVLAIARGGLLIGGAIGYALSVKNVYTMNVEFYTGVDERLEVPRILPPAPDFVDVSDARILIVDDVADTGHTLRSVQEFVDGKVGRSAHRCALREVALGGEVRLHLEAHRQVDQLPVERSGSGRQARLGGQRRLSDAEIRPLRCSGTPDAAPASTALRDVSGARCRAVGRRSTP